MLLAGHVEERLGEVSMPHIGELQSLQLLEILVELDRCLTAFL